MVRSLKVKDVISNGYKGILTDLNFAEALDKFEKDTDVLFIFESGTYLGSLTERAIIRSGFNKQNTFVKDFVMTAPKIEEETDLMECSRLMIENDVMQLPVFKENNLVGVVSVEAILKAVAKKMFGQEKALDFMSNDIIFCSPEDAVSTIVKLFRVHQISRLPVVKDGFLEGIITLHDIVKKAIQLDESPDVFVFMDNEKGFHSLTVDNIMTPSVVTVKGNTTIKQVINEMLDLDIGGVVVVDDEKLPIGMITKRDILEKIHIIQKTMVPVNIQLSSKIPLNNKEEIYQEIETFTFEHQKQIGTGHIYVYFKEIGRKSENNLSVQCRMHIHTDKYRTSIKTESVDELQAIRKCLEMFLESKITQRLDDLDKKMEGKKEIEI